MSILTENLNWRYATKKFDSTKTVSQEDLDTIMEAIRLSASSYGLQPYHVFVISDEETKAKLQPASWNQSQIIEASHIIVFANKPNFGEELINSFFDNVSQTRKIPSEKLKGYSDFMKSRLVGLSKDEKNVWTAKQAYLAMANAMNAAAELKIDSCPMEGFEPEKYNEILGLTDKGLNATVVLPIGYRSEEDDTQHHAKVRLSKEELFTLL